MGDRSIHGASILRYSSASTPRHSGAQHGAVGEKLISSMMQHAMPADQVDWVNAEEEQGLPYDVCVRRGGEIVLYAEVKSTAEEAKAVFELTLAELDLARQVGPQYTIYRVFSACSAAPRVAQLISCWTRLGSWQLAACSFSSLRRAVMRP